MKLTQIRPLFIPTVNLTDNKARSQQVPAKLSGLKWCHSKFQLPNIILQNLYERGNQDLLSHHGFGKFKHAGIAYMWSWSQPYFTLLNHRLKYDIDGGHSPNLQLDPLHPPNVPNSIGTIEQVALIMSKIMFQKNTYWLGLLCAKHPGLDCCAVPKVRW